MHGHPIYTVRMGHLLVLNWQPVQFLHRVGKIFKYSISQLQQFEFAFTTLIDELNYCNLNQRGYLIVQFDETQVQSQWIYVDSIKKPEYVIDKSRGYQLSLDKNLLPVKTGQQVA
jgi:alkaline phosphatase D